MSHSRPRVGSTRVLSDVVVTADRAHEPREIIPAGLRSGHRRTSSGSAPTDEEREEVEFAPPDVPSDLVPYYFPTAGFAARLGLEWGF